MNKRKSSKMINKKKSIKNNRKANSKNSNNKSNHTKSIKNTKKNNSSKSKRNQFIIRTLLLISGFLLFINVGFMYVVANPTAGFTVQGIISIALIIYAIYFDNISRKIHIFIFIMFLIPLVFSIFLGIYGNQKQVDYTEDVIIVLGAGVNGRMVSRPLSHRLNATIEYWHQNPDATIIVTGGLGNRATITEAEAMAYFLIRRGIPEDVILLEELSTSTFENLVFAKEIADEHFPEGFNAVLITNDFHIYRAVRTARQLGIDVVPVGAYTDWYTWPVNYIREMMAVINFKITNFIN
jgi:uncharacterized SAM-binding protein YcdF (DUF218 family)